MYEYLFWIVLFAFWTNLVVYECRIWWWRHSFYSAVEVGVNQQNIIHALCLLFPEMEPTATLSEVLDMSKERLCPFPLCENPVKPDRVCCRHHWEEMDKPDRLDLERNFSDYRQDKISMRELREEQYKILSKYLTFASEPSNDTARKLVLVCRRALEYVNLHKNLNKTPNGATDEVRKLTKELAAKELVLTSLIKEFLMSANGSQPLFENPPKEDKPEFLPPAH